MHDDMRMIANCLLQKKVISSAMFLIKVLAVDRNFRRLKIGRRLMNRVIEDVKTLNENRRVSNYFSMIITTTIFSITTNIMIFMTTQTVPADRGGNLPASDV